VLIKNKEIVALIGDMQDNSKIPRLQIESVTSSFPALETASRTVGTAQQSTERRHSPSSFPIEVDFNGEVGKAFKRRFSKPTVKFQSLINTSYSYR
jgi:hypothetical protein